MAKQQKRVKKNKYTIEAEINKQTADRTQYLVKKKGSIEFNASKQTLSNKWLFQDVPFVNSTEKGHYKPTKFYLSQNEVENLEKLLTDFDIPEIIWDDLKFTWLNMVFAQKTAQHKDQIAKNYNSLMQDFYEAYDLIKQIACGEKGIRGFSISSAPKKKDGSLGAEHNQSFKTHIVSNLLMDIFSVYTESSKHAMYQSMYEQHRDHNPKKNGSSGKSKNSKSESVSRYSAELYSFLRDQLFNPPFGMDLSEGFEPYFEYYRSQTKKFSNNRLYLFIGKLMILAGLTDEVDEVSELADDTIRDRMKKKLAPYIAAQKKREQIDSMPHEEKED